MSGAYEIIYTSSTSLLNENQTDLGVLQATQGIPDIVLRGQSLHRSFPFSEIGHAKTKEVPHKFLFRKLNDQYHLSHIIYAGADHTGRDAPYAHEIVIPKQLLDQKSEFGRCLPCDVFKHFHQFIHTSPIQSTPKWLEPRPVPERLPKADSQKSLDDALKSIPEHQLVEILNALASHSEGGFVPIIIDEAKWASDAADISYKILRCLPPHLQSGILAQPGSLSPNDIPQDVRLVLIPSCSPLSEDARKFSRFIDLTAKQKTKPGEVASAAQKKPHGYGTMFVRKRELVTRSTWNFFKLTGSNGELDCYLILQHKKAAQKGESSELLCCCQGVVNAKSTSVKTHFAKRLQALIDKDVPVDQVPECVQALRAAFPQNPEFARRLITKSEKSLLDSDHLAASLEKELIQWLQQHQTGTRPGVPKSLLMKHFDGCQPENKSTIIDLVAPPNSLSIWSDLIWGHDHALDKTKYVDEFANRIKTKRDVLPEIAKSEGCRRIVKKVLIDQQRYWMRRTSTGEEVCVVNTQNQWEWIDYFRKFNLEPDRLNAPWWPVGNSFAESFTDIQASSPQRHRPTTTIMADSSNPSVAELWPIIPVVVLLLVLMFFFSSKELLTKLTTRFNSQNNSVIEGENGAETQDPTNNGSAVQPKPAETTSPPPPLPKAKQAGRTVEIHQTPLNQQDPKDK